LNKASFLFQVNSPNLKPIIHLLIILLCQDFPEYILTAELIKIFGIIEQREKIFFSAFLKIGCLLYKNIFFQKNGEQNNKDFCEIEFFLEVIILFKFCSFTSRSTGVFY